MERDAGKEMERAERAAQQERWSKEEGRRSRGKKIPAELEASLTRLLASHEARVAKMERNHDAKLKRVEQRLHEVEEGNRRLAAMNKGLGEQMSTMYALLEQNTRMVALVLKRTPQPLEEVMSPLTRSQGGGGDMPNISKLALPVPPIAAGSPGGMAAVARLGGGVVAAPSLEE